MAETIGQDLVVCVMKRTCFVQDELQAASIDMIYYFFEIQQLDGATFQMPGRILEDCRTLAAANRPDGIQAILMRNSLLKSSPPLSGS